MTVDELAAATCVDPADVRGRPRLDRRRGRHAAGRHPDPAGDRRAPRAEPRQPAHRPGALLQGPRNLRPGADAARRHDHDRYREDGPSLARAWVLAGIIVVGSAVVVDSTCSAPAARQRGGSPRRRRSRSSRCRSTCSRSDPPPFARSKRPDGRSCPPPAVGRRPVTGRQPVPQAPL